MGSCVSVHKDKEAAMKFRFSFGSSNDQIPSPVKEKPASVTGTDLKVADVAPKSNWSPARPVNSGSKEETFFDSQAWLDSDCEDDFFSVNGDFTPSRGNTPVHHSFSAGNPRVNRPVGSEADPYPAPLQSPSDKKKRLVELFKESVGGEQYLKEQNAAGKENNIPATDATILSPASKSATGTPYLNRAKSGYSSERTPNSVFRTEGKSLKPAQCCLPRLRASHSFSERKQKMSLAQNLG